MNSEPDGLAEGRERLLVLALLALIAGAASGLLGAFFRLALERADRFRDSVVAWAHGEALAGLLLIISVVFSFQVFDLIYVMTGGGPGFSTTVLVGYIFRAAFMQFKMGYASALGMVLFALVLAFTAVQWRLSRQGDTTTIY